MTVLRNRARCLGCGYLVESKSRWDYVSCPCGALSVDGGHDYVRRVFDSNIPFEELSEETEDGA